MARPGTSSVNVAASAGEAKLCDFSTKAAWPLSYASLAAWYAVTPSPAVGSRLPPMVSGTKWQCMSMAPLMRRPLTPRCLHRGRVHHLAHHAAAHELVDGIVVIPEFTQDLARVLARNERRSLHDAGCVREVP